MATDSWRQVRLGDHVRLHSGGTPSKARPEFWGGVIPWISANSMKSLRLCSAELFLTPLGLEAGSRLAPEGSVLLLVRGSELHKRIPIGMPTAPVAFNQDVKWLKPDSTIIPEFLLYWLLAHESLLLSKVEQTGIGAGKLDSAVLEDLKLCLPPSELQAEIAKFFRVLDDKIDLNRRLNETLEATARAIFKSWFVDFDPVRAKAEGRQPGGMSADIATLFPVKFVDSTFGRIPAGWRTTTLGAEADRCRGAIQTGPFGSQLHASDYVSEGVPVVMPQDIKNRRVSTAKIARIGEGDANRLSRHRLKDGDVVYSRRGDVEIHALVGPREEGWLCGTGCLLLRLGPKWPSPAFASLALDQPETRAWISQHAIGATMPNLNTGILSAVPIVVPPDPLLKVFSEVVEPLNKMVVANDAECETLTALRDTLLPKLLSGEVRIATAVSAGGAH